MDLATHPIESLARLVANGAVDIDSIPRFRRLAVQELLPASVDPVSAPQSSIDISTLPNKRAVVDYVAETFGITFDMTMKRSEMDEEAQRLANNP
jgi:hypothetical protein